MANLGLGIFQVLLYACLHVQMCPILLYTSFYYPMNLCHLKTWFLISNESCFVCMTCRNKPIVSSYLEVEFEKKINYCP